MTGNTEKEFTDPEENVSVDLVGRTVPEWNAIDNSVRMSYFEQDAEMTIALAARGDYYSDSLEETSLTEIFDGVSYDKSHEELAEEAGVFEYDDQSKEVFEAYYDADEYYDLECKKAKLIERFFDVGTGVYLNMHLHPSLSTTSHV
jgi:hypothetical protein